MLHADWRDPERKGTPGSHGTERLVKGGAQDTDNHVVTGDGNTVGHHLMNRDTKSGRYLFVTADSCAHPRVTASGLPRYDVDSTLETKPARMTRGPGTHETQETNQRLG